MFGSDAYTPSEIASRVEAAGVTKARLPLLPLCMLGLLGGAFIGFGALYFTLVTSDAELTFAIGRLLGGLVFSLGLVLVVVAGAELFTGNNLLAIAWAEGRISTAELLKNWLIVYVSNAVGAMGLVLLVVWSHHAGLNGGRVALQAVSIAAAKAALPFWPAFFKGVLCNALVCLAVWLAMAGRSVTDKVLAVIFPVSAFVAAGFEHSVANMYFIPLGILLQDSVPLHAPLQWWDLARNLLPVTLGNIVGGSIMVALVYHVIYQRGRKDSQVKS